VRRTLLLLLALVLGLVGCGGDTEVVRERDVEVPGAATGQGGARSEMAREPDGSVRIVVVTHGQASSPFWAIVRNGVEAGARQMDVAVEYRRSEKRRVGEEWRSWWSPSP